MNQIKNRFLLRCLFVFVLALLIALGCLSKSPDFLWIATIFFGLLIACLATVYRFFISEIRPLLEISALAARYLRKSSGKERQRGRDRVNALSVDPWLKLRGDIKSLYEQIALNASASRENSDQLESILEGMTEGVLAVGADRRILTINAAARRLLGLSQPNLVGRKLLEVCRLPELNQLIDEVLESQQSGKSEFETTTVPRYQIAAQATTRTTPSVGRSITIVLHDVTEMRRMETMRRDFFSNVSHELKTPLASIKAYAETLKLGAMNDPKMCAEFVTQIESDADRLNKQIQDLLQLSRVESGQYIFDMTAVCLNDVCQRCVRQFSSTSDAARIELGFENPEQELFTWADEEGVEAILNNLISNAIRYTPDGGRVKVELSLIRNAKFPGPASEDSGISPVNSQLPLFDHVGLEPVSLAEDEVASAMVALSVQDTGIGIPADKLSRIFERFYRVDKSRSRDQGGTGLGLSIVKHMTSSFGGWIDVQSKIGRGSRFIVYLPVHVESQDELVGESQSDFNRRPSLLENVSLEEDAE